MICKVVGLIFSSVFNVFIVLLLFWGAVEILKVGIPFLEKENLWTTWIGIKKMATELDFEPIESLLVLMGYCFVEYPIVYWSSIALSVVLSCGYVMMTPMEQYNNLNRALLLTEVFAVIESCIRFQITYRFSIRVYDINYNILKETLNGAPKSFMKYIENFSEVGIENTFVTITTIYAAGILATQICLKLRMDINESKCGRIVNMFRKQCVLKENDRKRYYYFGGTENLLYQEERILELEEKIVRLEKRISKMERN